MARLPEQRRKRSSSHARRRPGGGVAQVNPNDTLFFPRLRTHAKWMFVALAIVFSISFVAFGVGSGSTGISQSFTNGFGLFGSSSSSGGTSVSKAQHFADKHPTSGSAYRALATALETANRTDDAVVALQRYTQLKPRDASALGELAGLYLKQVSNAQQAAQVANSAATPVTGAGIFGPSSTSQLGKGLGTDPLVGAVTSKANGILSTLYGKAQVAAQSAIATYQQLAKVTPDDPNVQLELAQAAQSVGNATVAVAAFKTFLRLAPNDPSASAVRQAIKRLEPAKPKKK